MHILQQRKVESNNSIAGKIGSTWRIAVWIGKGWRKHLQAAVGLFNMKSPSFIMASSSKFTVGYALTAKKTQSFMQPALISLARSKGITFAAIDRSRPLEEQGPFDVILHKLTTEAWNQQLRAYKLRDPEVLILDPPEAIKKVYNRQSMLQEVAALNFRHCRGKVGIPKQLVVDNDSTSISEKVARAGLKFPLVAKPKFVDGTANSHALSLAFNEVCLSELRPPLVLQEFINHGGVLFKVYIIGHIIKVVRRFSLPDVRENEVNKSGVIPFPRVSCAAASADGADLDPIVRELPPREMLESLSRELRGRLGLSLFNLDMIREGGKGSRFYVIDINYFPGYGKMPDYEKVFTDFLSSLAERKHKVSSVR
ncbi:hypothetical protein GOP47_0002509 [Adiantum capillus-veneris]|uniref:Inositol-tetrakisphosphate 1-kinase n=1 Tax=Adiantum capillus-veneris TaxID=13818 RepID=A0A9D4ZR09_ADICA|nr:hypothetical protein GOP47_0002509 [Adiantum capillus-veneris]